jgi:hypothetical protein
MILRFVVIRIIIMLLVQCVIRLSWFIASFIRCVYLFATKLFDCNQNMNVKFVDTYARTSLRLCVSRAKRC